MSKRLNLYSKLRYDINCFSNPLNFRPLVPNRVFTTSTVYGHLRCMVTTHYCCTTVRYTHTHCKLNYPAVYSTELQKHNYIIEISNRAATIFKWLPQKQGNPCTIFNLLFATRTTGATWRSNDQEAPQNTYNSVRREFAGTETAIWRSQLGGMEGHRVPSQRSCD